MFQARDLRRLLEMYIGWQQRMFPYAPFDAFIEGLEKLGSSYVLKVTFHSKLTMLRSSKPNWPLLRPYIGDIMAI